MSVRRLETGDERIAEAACRLFDLTGDIDATTFLGRPETVLLLAEEGDRIAGWVYGHELIHPDGERTMLLYALDVVEDLRRRGHGRALVSAFVDESRRRGCTEVWVLTDDANPAGLATYAAAAGARDPTPQVMFSWRLSEGRHS